MGRTAISWLVAIFALLPSGLRAEDASAGTCPPEANSFGTVAEVVDAVTLRLGGGETLFLDGVDVPRAGVAGQAPEAAAAARRAVAEWLGTGARVRYVAREADRHGRLPAHVFGPDGTWLQERLVAAGYGRVRPFPGNGRCSDRLLAVEGEARSAGLGFWPREFAPIGADDPSLVGRKGLYSIVEGRIVSVGHGNRMSFLNFGYRWQRDFTVMVGAAVAARLAETGVSLDTLSDRRVRVRGVVEERGGPAIWLNDIREIEVLDDD